MNMSNYVKIQISPMYLHKAQNPRACHNYRNLPINNPKRDIVGTSAYAKFE